MGCRVMVHSQEVGGGGVLRISSDRDDQRSWDFLGFEIFDFGVA